jgi:hypothetical protein
MQATMQKPATSLGSPVLANLIGIVIAALVVATLTNTSLPLPLLGSERAVFVAAVLLGVTMCSLGGVGRAPMKFGWMHPVTLFGIAVGTIMLLLAASVVLGQVTEQIGLMVFTALFAPKWVVGLAFVR